MKKILKWIGIAVLTPILLFIILAALLYLPPVQNWAVQKVTAIASDKTGMEISVGHVNLEWPFDLGIDDFRILHDNDSLPGVRDTIADIRKLVADIRLWPLLEKRVVINELSLHQAKINTNGFISDLRVKGEFEQLWLASDGINLNQETVEVNGARLSGAQLDIALSDTAAVDTTESDIRWKIKVDSLSIYDTAVNLHLPGDTLDVGIKMGSAVAREADIDLGRETYQIGKVEWSAGGLTYDDKWMPRADGLDLNHLALSDISLAIDSISYTPKGTSLMVRHTAMKEKCGLEIIELKGLVRLDSAFNNIQLPGMTLRTPDSDIHAEADLDFNIADALKPGRMRLRLFAQIDKQDLMHFMGGLPQSFIRHYPNHPISIKGSVNGNMRKMDFTGLDISLPTALHLHANGTAEHLTDMSRMKADISFRGQTQDLNFLTALIDDRQKGEFRIPSGITLDGRLKADGTRYDADLNAREGEGLVKAKIGAVVPQDAKGNLNTEAMTYDADISIDNLNLHHFLPKDSLYTLSADIHANGYGTDTQSGAGERAKTFRSGTNQGESKDFRSRIPPGDGNKESQSRAPQGNGNRSGQKRPPRQQNGDHQGQNGAQPAGTGADGAAGARAATGGNGASVGNGDSGGSGVPGGNGAAAARPFSRRPAPGPTRAQKALWEKQCLLLTWIIDDPRIFPQISRYLQPDDFDGEIYVQTASRLWDQLRKDPEAANAASVISSFETPQEQEAAAAMFNSHLEGIEDKNDREKTLRELVFFIKQASLDRMTRAGGAGSLQTLLTAKQQLQSLRSANFHL